MTQQTHLEKKSDVIAELAKAVRSPLFYVGIAVGLAIAWVSPIYDVHVGEFNDYSILYKTHRLTGQTMLVFPNGKERIAASVEK